MRLSIAARSARKTGKSYVFTHGRRTVVVLPTGALRTFPGVTLSKEF